MESFQPFSLNLRGRLMEFDRPAVMGILNSTPDSFYADSRMSTDDAIARRVDQMLAEGVDIIDIGGCSTRPGFQAPSTAEETRRVVRAVEITRRADSSIPVSVDTYRGAVAREAIAAGADIVNDISAFTLDDDMRQAVVDLKAPYILTHPSRSSLTADMDADATVATVITDLQRIIRELTLEGVADIIVDPGFGFGKTLDQNYWLLGGLPWLKKLGCPLLVGVSRKSMFTKLLSITPAEALEATTAANALALAGGASILRVHDVKAGRQVVEVYTKIPNLPIEIDAACGVANIVKNF